MYEGRIFRPPSEASSLIIQVTVGCAHNGCTFCSMYRDKQFKIKPLEEVLQDLEDLSSEYSWVERIFIADGDALILPMAYWRTVLQKIAFLFPKVKRITSYGTPKDVIGKTDEELKELKQLGLQMIYMGLESGSDRILERINKGVSSAEMILAAQKLKAAGIKQSITVISGIGGRSDWEDHAAETARVLNEMNPEYVGLLTLMMDEETPLVESVRKGEMAMLSPLEVLEETKQLILRLSLDNCHFRSNHASNYVALAGHFPEDKNHLLDQIDKALSGKSLMRSEGMRRL